MHAYYRCTYYAYILYVCTYYAYILYVIPSDKHARCFTFCFQLSQILQRMYTAKTILFAKIFTFSAHLFPLHFPLLIFTFSIHLFPLLTSKFLLSPGKFSCTRKWSYITFISPNIYFTGYKQLFPSSTSFIWPQGPHFYGLWSETHDNEKRYSPRSSLSYFSCCFQHCFCFFVLVLRLIVTCLHEFCCVFSISDMLLYKCVKFLIHLSQ